MVYAQSHKGNPIAWPHSVRFSSICVQNQISQDPLARS